MPTVSYIGSATHRIDQLQSAGNKGTTGTASVSFVGATAGSLLVVFIHYSDPLNSATTPAGWTARTKRDGTSTSVQCFYKTAAGGETSFSATLALANAWCVTMAEFRGASDIAFANDGAQSVTLSTVFDGPATSTLALGRFLVLVGASFDGNNVFTSTMNLANTQARANISGGFAWCREDDGQGSITTFCPLTNTTGSGVTTTVLFQLPELQINMNPQVGDEVVAVTGLDAPGATVQVVDVGGGADFATFALDTERDDGAAVRRLSVSSVRATGTGNILASFYCTTKTKGAQSTVAALLQVSTIPVTYRDQAISAGGSSTTPASGVVSGTGTDEVAVGAFLSVGGSTNFTPSAGWTTDVNDVLVDGTNPCAIAVFHQLTTAGGSFNLDGTLNFSASWAAACALYFLLSSATPRRRALLGVGR